MIINITHVLIALAILLVLILVKINYYDKNKLCLDKEIKEFNLLQKKYLNQTNKTIIGLPIL